MHGPLELPDRISMKICTEDIETLANLMNQFNQTEGEEGDGRRIIVNIFTNNTFQLVQLTQVENRPAQNGVPEATITETEVGHVAGPAHRLDCSVNMQRTLCGPRAEERGESTRAEQSGMGISTSQDTGNVSGTGEGQQAQSARSGGWRWQSCPGAWLLGVWEGQKNSC